MDHQYIPKIFHYPHKNPLTHPSAYLIYGPLLARAAEAGFLKNWNAFYDQGKVKCF